MIKAVIFDLWGTLVENGVNPSPSKQVRYFLRTRVQFSEFITTFEDTFMTKDYDSLQKAFEAVVNDFNLKVPSFVYDKMIGMWNKNAILSKMYEDVEPGIKALKEKGIKVILLANTDKFSYEQVSSKFNFNELFDAQYISYQTGLLKVNPDSYKQILKDLKLKANEVLMVGDSVDSDMKSAEAAGIKGILMDRRQTRVEYENNIKSLEELEPFL